MKKLRVLPFCEVPFMRYVELAQDTLLHVWVKISKTPWCMLMLISPITLFFFDFHPIEAMTERNAPRDVDCR